MSYTRHEPCLKPTKTTFNFTTRLGRHQLNSKQNPSKDVWKPLTQIGTTQLRSSSRRSLELSKGSYCRRKTAILHVLALSEYVYAYLFVRFLGNLLVICVWNMRPQAQYGLIFVQHSMVQFSAVCAICLRAMAACNGLRPLGSVGDHVRPPPPPSLLLWRPPGPQPCLPQ